MGCGAGKDLQYKVLEKEATFASPGSKVEEARWHLPNGGRVIVLHDCDPSDIYWPPRWGKPLPLQTSLLLQVTQDDGSELAFGHPVNQPEKGGYFLKHYAVPLEDCLRPTAPQPALHSHRVERTLEATRADCHLPAAPAMDVAGIYAPMDSDQTPFEEPMPWRSGRSMAQPPPGHVQRPSRQTAGGHGDAAGGPSTVTRSAPELSSSDAQRRASLGRELRSDRVRSHLPSRTSRDPHMFVDSSTPSAQASAYQWAKRDPEATPGPPSPTLAHPMLATSFRAVASSAKGTAGFKCSEVVQKAAQELGLDPQHDEQFLWIAEHAAKAELPADWTEFQDDTGRAAFYHPVTKRISRVHPVLLKYRNFISKLRTVRERVGIADRKVRPHVAVILNEMLNRVNKELSPVTPEIIERLAVLLGIDTAVDHPLTSRLKAAIEVYVEDQYDIAVQVAQKADTNSFLATMRKEQVAVEVLNKPDVVVMCSELEWLPAQVKCEQCKDFFSLEGFAKVHPSGKRKHHTTVRCQQVVCSVYSHEFATCEVDGQLLCDRAYEELAARSPELRCKHRRILGGLMCSEYPERRAEVLCEDCSDLLCWEAFVQLHGHGNRQWHVPLRFDHNCSLYRAGQLCPPEEAARLISRAKLARDGGPWLAFRDDRLDTFWYHLSDKVTTRQNPYL